MILREKSSNYCLLPPFLPFLPTYIFRLCRLFSFIRSIVFSIACLYFGGIERKRSPSGDRSGGRGGRAGFGGRLFVGFCALESLMASALAAIKVAIKMIRRRLVRNNVSAMRAHHAVFW